MADTAGLVGEARNLLGVEGGDQKADQAIGIRADDLGRHGAITGGDGVESGHLHLLCHAGSVAGPP